MVPVQRAGNLRLKPGQLEEVGRRCGGGGIVLGGALGGHKHPSTRLQTELPSLKSPESGSSDSGGGTESPLKIIGRLQRMCLTLGIPVLWQFLNSCRTQLSFGFTSGSQRERVESSWMWKRRQQCSVWLLAWPLSFREGEKDCFSDQTVPFAPD